MRTTAATILALLVTLVLVLAAAVTDGPSGQRVIGSEEAVVAQAALTTAPLVAHAAADVLTQPPGTSGTPQPLERPEPSVADSAQLALAPLFLGLAMVAAGLLGLRHARRVRLAAREGTTGV